MPKTLLITGASGFLGWNLCRIAAPRWRVVGLYHRHKITIPNVVTLPSNLTDPDKTSDLFAAVRPDAVIHTAAASKPDDCERYPDKTATINIDASATLARLCADRSIPFVFTSSDLVFNGRHAPYAEASPPTPINTYGRQKLTAETAIRACCPDAAICRMPLMFGYTEGQQRSFTDQMIVAIMESAPLSLFRDEYRTPVDAGSASRGLLMAVDRFQGRVINLGGRQRHSRADMGDIIERLLGITASTINRISQREAASVAPRPADVSLDSTAAFALGYDPTDVTVALEMLVHRYTRR
jgi:dTDP-4-dehydrorhamnose reductase